MSAGGEGLSEREKVYRVGLNHFPEVGAVRQRILLEAFGSIEAAWNAEARELAALKRFSKGVADKMRAFCRDNDPQVLYQRVRDAGYGLVFLGEPDYPSQLASIYDPPALLYWRGRPDALARLQRCVAIVGTREATKYGLAIARRMGEYLAENGVAVVSGMALGIDAEAHRGALNTGLTVAVLGSGIDVVAPPSHQALYTRICEAGLVLAELPPGHPPAAWTFPMRNRIVSGLSQALVVVEAGIKSGTLITVDCANDQGRDVFAVPGPIGATQSKGTNHLIQQGAHLLMHPDELLEAMGWREIDTSAPPGGKSDLDVHLSLTKPEVEVYRLLSEQPQHIDQLAESLCQEARQVSGQLTLLELKGLVEQLPGKLYKKKSHF